MGSYLDLLERALIVRDSEGTAIRFVGSLMDVTARKQLQDQLVRSQKMEAFGQLAGGVAHDFNNFLTTILGYSDLLLDELGMKGAIADHISEIRSAAGRASVLTAQLLAFSRKHPLAPRVIDVNSLLTNLERSLLRLLGEDISVQCHFDRAKEGLAHQSGSRPADANHLESGGERARCDALWRTPYAGNGCDDHRYPRRTGDRLRASSNQASMFGSASPTTASG